MIFDHNTEIVLLTNWINNRNREDIALFPADMFSDKELYQEATKPDGERKTYLQLLSEGLAKGKNVEEIMKTNTFEWEYLIELDKALAVYEEALKSKIKKGADLDHIGQELAKISERRKRREARPAAKGLAATFFNELENAAKKGRIEYGEGFAELDAYIRPMRRGQLVIFAARPATGKSAVGLQIGYNAAKKGHKVLFFTLENTLIETMERLLCHSRTIENLEEIENPETLGAKLTGDIYNFLEDIEKAGNFLIYDGKTNALETIAQTIREQRPDLVILDQLSCVKTAIKTKDIRERFIEVTTGLKSIAIESDTVILALTQLNREVTAGRKATLENLHESDSTGQNADVVILMENKNEEYDKDAFEKYITFHVVKNRQGRSHIKITRKFIGEHFRFYPED